MIDPEALELAALSILTCCRECKDEMPVYAKDVPPADFILWGKLLPPEAFGPRCYEHTVKHLGHGAMSQIDQYAVVDLRPIRRALGLPLS